MKPRRLASATAFSISCSRGTVIGSAPPSASPTPPHEWGGLVLHQPLRRLRRHLPMNGEDRTPHECGGHHRSNQSPAFNPDSPNLQSQLPPQHRFNQSPPSIPTPLISFPPPTLHSGTWSSGRLGISGGGPCGNRAAPGGRLRSKPSAGRPASTFYMS